ncbi:hypothetical protein BN903_103 [Halorubrum sp. AJ67]|nr:hypothetical protein BN903_103 [Halorubrum sp. AJ67]
MRFEVGGEPRLDLLAVAQQFPVLVRVGAVADHPAVPHVVVLRAAGATEHLEHVQRRDVGLALQRVVVLRVADDDAAGGEVHPPRERRRREEELDLPLLEPLLNAVAVVLPEAGVVEADAVGHRLAERVVREFLRLVVEVVVVPRVDGDVALGDLVARLLGRLNRVLSRGDEHERLPVLADVRLCQVQRAVEPAVLVGERVRPVRVRLYARLQIDRAVLVAERVGRLRGRVEPLGDIVDVRHRRGERDDAGVLKPAEPRDGDLQHRAALLGVEQVDLVDDDAVHVGDKGVARGVVFPRRAVGLLRGRHQHVRALGAARVQVALAGDDVHGVAHVLEPLPLALLLVGERAQRRDEEGRSALREGLTDGEFGERRLPGGRRGRRDDVAVGLQDARQRLALHPVELLEPEGVGELRHRVRDLHGTPHPCASRREPRLCRIGSRGGLRGQRRFSCEPSPQTHTV